MSDQDFQKNMLDFRDQMLKFQEETTKFQEETTKFQEEALKRFDSLERGQADIREDISLQGAYMKESFEKLSSTMVQMMDHEERLRVLERKVLVAA